jgi:hypothetical protein
MFSFSFGKERASQCAVYSASPRICLSKLQSLVSLG